MVLLVERDYESVSGIWTGCHIFLFAICIIFSMTSAIIFHILIINFDMNCILNPKSIIILKDLVYKSDRLYYNNPINGTTRQIDLPIDFIKSQWSSMDDCHEPLYNPILSVIFGTTWLTFFLMCSNGGRSIAGVQQPWRIVLPCFLFSFVYSIICIVISQKLTTGLDNFNSHMINLTNINDPNVIYNFTKTELYATVTLASTWIFTSCWILSFCLLLLRCLAMPDFKVLKLRIDSTNGGNDKVGDSKRGAYKPLMREEQTKSPLLEYDEPSTSSTVTTANVVVEPVRTKDDD